MTDNLKQRIAEAISGAKHFDDILPAVLDIVEPMLNGLQGVIDSQQQTNQALIKRIVQLQPPQIYGQPAKE